MLFNLGIIEIYAMPLAKMPVYENRTGMYIEVHEERKRRKQAFTARRSSKYRNSEKFCINLHSVKKL